MLGKCKDTTARSKGGKYLSNLQVCSQFPSLNAFDIIRASPTTGTFLQITSLTPTKNWTEKINNLHLWDSSNALVSATESPKFSKIYNASKWGRSSAKSSAYWFTLSLTLFKLLHRFCKESDSSYKVSNRFRHSSKCFLLMTGSKTSLFSSHNLQIYLSAYAATQQHVFYYLYAAYA